MFALLSTLSVSKRYNRMRMAVIAHNKTQFFFPEKRIDMVKEAFDRLKEGQCTVKGSAEIREHLREFFQKHQKVTAEDAEENKGSFSFNPSWSQQAGFGISASVSVTFAKKGEEDEDDEPEVVEAEENGLKSRKQIKIPRLSMEYKNKKGKLVKLFITRVKTQHGDFFLPTRTPGKFKNLAKKLLAGKVHAE